MLQGGSQLTHICMRAHTHTHVRAQAHTLRCLSYTPCTPTVLSVERKTLHGHTLKILSFLTDTDTATPHPLQYTHRHTHTYHRSVPKQNRNIVVKIPNALYQMKEPVLKRVFLLTAVFDCAELFILLPKGLTNLSLFYTLTSQERAVRSCVPGFLNFKKC